MRRKNPFNHFVLNTVPWPSSCTASPLKNEPIVPCANSATAKPSHSPWLKKNAVARPVAANRARWPPACNQPLASLRWLSARSVAASIGERYQATRNVLRTCASGS